MKKNYISFLIAISFFALKTNAQILTIPLDGNANDISGHNNHGTIEGNVTSANNRLGQPNKAYHFPGTQNDFIYIAPSWANYDFNITQTDSLSVSLWMQPENTTGDQYVFAKRDTLWSTSQASDYDITVSSASINSRFNLSYALNVTDYNSTNPQLWYHVVITYSNGLSKLYVNDTLRTSNPSSPIDSMANLIVIGQYFKGEIDDINFFHKALTASEVDNLYRYGSTTGIKNEMAKLNINVFPNPSSDFVSINNFNQEMLDVELYDMLGNRKISERINANTKLDLRNNSRGVYLLRVSNINESQTYRIIIN